MGEFIKKYGKREGGRLMSIYLSFREKSRMPPEKLADCKSAFETGFSEAELVDTGYWEIKNQVREKDLFGE
jgi:hypothetical protein